MRDYVPGYGRYAQADPIGHRGGMNLYTYANINPLALADPDGRNAIAITAGIGSIGGPGGTAVGIGVGILINVGICLAGGCEAVLDLFSDVSDDGEVRDGEFTARRTCDDDGPDCDAQYENDLSMCRAIGRTGNKRRATLCYQSALERKIACESGRPVPPLITWNN
jgi:uncharacterized protein RhaS with RHS repeats